MSLDAVDAGGLAADRHGPLSAVWSGHCRAAHVEGHVLLSAVCSTFGVLQQLLRLAVLVHRYTQHLLLSTQSVNQSNPFSRVGTAQRVTFGLLHAAVAVLPYCGTFNMCNGSTFYVQSANQI